MRSDSSKWLLPMVLTALIAGVGGAAWAGRAGFMADEAYRAAKDVPVVKAANESDHKAIQAQLNRIEARLDEIARRK